MNQKAYLFILIGAVMSATMFIPLPPEIMRLWSFLTFWGYLLISAGLPGLNRPTKEVQNARLFTLLALLTNFITPFVPQLFGVTRVLTFATGSLQVFFSVGIFFWVLKAEYMWSPRGSKRTDFIVYSFVAAIYLAIYIMFLSPLIGIGLSTPLMFTLLRALQFTNILYYVILLFTLIKLYRESRSAY